VVAEAPQEALPEVLRAPPWTTGRRPPAPARLARDLAVLEAPVVEDWRGDERARWQHVEALPAHLQTLGDERAWRDAAQRRLDLLGESRERLGGLGADAWELRWFLLHAPRPVAAWVARRWEPSGRWNEAALLRGAVARLGADALPLVERCAAAKAWGVEAALPLGAPSLAPAVAAGLGKATVRDAARAWLRRHPEPAAIGLVPHALGRAAARRRHAIAALKSLLRRGHGALVRDVAARYGADAAEALAPLLDASPLDDFPARRPSLPRWFDPDALPSPELADGAGAIGRDAVIHLATMLAFSQLGAPYAGIDDVEAACDRASLAAFSWALFEAWLDAGAPNGERWAMAQLGWLGDADAAYGLVTHMRQWPAQGASKRAERALDVLAEMDGDVPLVLVHELSQRGRGSLRKNAQRKLARIAALRGLGRDALADRLVPTLGLDPDGTMSLDYGRRAFRVGFDEELRPFVLDDRGKERKALPRPGKRDDPALAPAAEARFKALKKAVRAVAKTQVARFEAALRDGRRWTGADFSRYVVRHPLLVHLARRLVFARYDDDGLAVAFRVTEDRELADVDEEPVAVPDDASVGLAHPVELGPDAIARWKEVLSDYELLQPLPQLARWCARTAPDARDAALEGALGVDVFATRVAALEKRGWVRGPVDDEGVFHIMERALGPGRRARLLLHPGIVSGMVHLSEPQLLAGVQLQDARGPLALASLSAVEFSELMRDLTSMVDQGAV